MLNISETHAALVRRLDAEGMSREVIAAQLSLQEQIEACLATA